MYRQLDDVSLERFEAFGRVKDNKLKSGEGVLQLVGRDTKTGALVRYDAQPPPADWPPRAAPSEFSHWLVHTQEYVHYSYPVAEGPDGRSVVWTVNSNIDCPNEFGWHVSQKKPPRVAVRARLRRSKQREHCTANLDELQQIWRAKAEHELAELLEVHARYDEFKALPLIVLPD
jgi:hypothetical protein